LLSDAHWTDEQIIASLYGVGPENGHLERCENCSLRRSSFVANSRAADAARLGDEGVSFEFLAAQRQAIYEKLETPSVWKSVLGWRRWAPVALTLCLLAAGAAVYDGRHMHHVARTQLSDAQLALEVSRMSQDWEAQPAAPLEGLFE
jgi:hypothetical protein